jgi:CheY-like chemotaxis protein
VRFRKDGRRTTEVTVAVQALNQMLELGRPTSVRIAWIQMGPGCCNLLVDPCNIAMAVAALKEGAVDFVEKPFDPGMLLDSVREALQACGRHRGAQGGGDGYRSAAIDADAT